MDIILINVLTKFVGGKNSPKNIRPQNFLKTYDKSSTSMREKFHLRMCIAILEHKLKTCSNNDIIDISYKYKTNSLIQSCLVPGVDKSTCQ